MGANAGAPAPRHRADARAALLRNELGYLLRAQGDSAAARPYYERALAIREQVLGLNHPNTRSSRASLAAIEERLAAEQ